MTYKLIETRPMAEWTGRDRFFVDKCFMSAFMSDFDLPLKLGACIVVNKKVFYCGYNQKHRMSIFKSMYKSVHAEIHALSNYIKNEYGQYSMHTQCNRSNITIYVVRLMSNPSLPPYGISKPCIRCQRFLQEHGIKYIKYTDVDEHKNQVLRTLQLDS